MARTPGATNAVPAKTGNPRVRCSYCDARRYCDDMYGRLNFKGQVIGYACGKCITDIHITDAQIKKLTGKKR